MSRPRADELLPVMLAQPPNPKLSEYARARAVSHRCRKRHLLAHTVPGPLGTWVLWRGDPRDRGWVCAWLDEIPDPATLPAWCSSCKTTGTLDLSVPADPEQMR